MIDIREVEYIGELARLKFDKDEKENIIKDFNNILGFLNKLSEANVENIGKQDTYCSNLLRGDEVCPSASREEMLQNAPEIQNGFIKIPKMIGDE